MFRQNLHLSIKTANETLKMKNLLEDDETTLHEVALTNFSLLRIGKIAPSKNTSTDKLNSVIILTIV